MKLLLLLFVIDEKEESALRSRPGENENGWVLVALARAKFCMVVIDLPFLPAWSSGSLNAIRCWSELASKPELPAGRRPASWEWPCPAARQLRPSQSVRERGLLEVRVDEWRRDSAEFRSW